MSLQKLLSIDTVSWPVDSSMIFSLRFSTFKIVELVRCLAQTQVSEDSTTPVSSHILCFFSPLCCPFLLNKSSPPTQIFFHCVACFSCTLHSLPHMRSGLSIFIMGVWPSHWCSLWVMGMCFSLLPCQNLNRSVRASS